MNGKWIKQAGWTVALLLAALTVLARAEREYLNARWRTMPFKTAAPGRRSNPTSFSSRAYCRTPGTLVLDKREYNNIYIVENGATNIIGLAALPGKQSRDGIRVDMSRYTSVVILNGNDYTIYGDEREISRVDPWGMWVVR